MVENEKLGFTFEVAPYDFKDFNRFFGATTPWVDGECSTQVWNGSQMPSAAGYANVGTADVIPRFQYISDKTAKEFESACNSYIDALSEVSKNLSPCLERLTAHFGKPTKRKKHYKPKFTL